MNRKAGVLLLCFASVFMVFPDDVMVVVDQSGSGNGTIGVEQVFSTINAAVQAGFGTLGIVRAGDYPVMIAPPGMVHRDLESKLALGLSVPVKEVRLGPALEYAASQLKQYAATTGAKRIYLISTGAGLPDKVSPQAMQGIDLCVFFTGNIDSAFKDEFKKNVVLKRSFDIASSQALTDAGAQILQDMLPFNNEGTAAGKSKPGTGTVLEAKAGNLTKTVYRMALVLGADGPVESISLTKKDTLTLTRASPTGNLGNLEARFIPAGNQAILLVVNPGQGNLQVAVPGGLPVTSFTVVEEGGRNLWLLAALGILGLIVIVVFCCALKYLFTPCWIIEIAHNNSALCEPKFAPVGIGKTMGPNKTLQEIINRFDGIDAGSVSQYFIRKKKKTWKLILEDAAQKEASAEDEEKYEPEEVIPNFRECIDEPQSLTGGFSITIKQAKGK
jgi:hypothetical protein